MCDERCKNSPSTNLCCMREIPKSKIVETSVEGTLEIPDIRPGRKFTKFHCRIHRGGYLVPCVTQLSDGMYTFLPSISRSGLAIIAEAAAVLQIIVCPHVNRSQKYDPSGFSVEHYADGDVNEDNEINHAKAGSIDDWDPMDASEVAETSLHERSL